MDLYLVTLCLLQCWRLKGFGVTQNIILVSYHKLEEYKLY